MSHTGFKLFSRNGYSRLKLMAQMQAEAFLKGRVKEPGTLTDGPLLLDPLAHSQEEGAEVLVFCK